MLRVGGMDRVLKFKYKCLRFVHSRGGAASSFLWVSTFAWRTFEEEAEADMMNKGGYGLQLRAPPSHKRPPRPPPSSVFAAAAAADDDDDVEQEIARHASKNKSLKDVEEQHRKALEEDPSVFEYDGVFDKMEQDKIRPVAQEKQERKSKYIQKLLDKSKEREREQEIIYERKLAKERSKEDHLFADKEKFVTGAYKRKLAEQAKWQEEERLRQLREEREDVTKMKDITAFYYNLEKNVAFGSNSEVSKNPLKRDPKPSNRSSEQGDKVESDGMKPDAKPLEGKEKLGESGGNFMISQVHVPSKSKSVSTSVGEGTSFAKERTADEMVQDSRVVTENEIAKDENTRSPGVAAAQPIQTHALNEDAVAAAKERYLARKRAKMQQ